MRIYRTTNCRTRHSWWRRVSSTLAAFVMQEDADFLQDVIRQYGLDIVSPQNLPGLIARYPWLTLGRYPGRSI